MNIRNLFTGGARAKAFLAKEDKFEKADEQLREMEARREHMREQLSEALRQIIEEHNR